jgi:hypothetical protein
MGHRVGSHDGGSGFDGSYQASVDGMEAHFGRAKIFSVAAPASSTDHAFWSHEDYATTANFAVMQEDTGTTWVNIPNNGAVIKFGRGGSTILQMTAGGDFQSATGSSLGASGARWGTVHANNIDLNNRVADGTGSSASLGSVGGTGRPTTAAQNGWIKIKDNGTDYWVPAWV